MRKSRDLSIEYIRIMACLFVIMIHVQTPLLVMNGDIINESLLISCIIGDAVALFFAITGAFWFGNKKYTTVVNKHIRNVIVPSMASVIFFMMIQGYIFSPFLKPGWLDVSMPRWKDVLDGMFFWNFRIWGDMFSHYWYLFSFSNYCYCIRL